MITWPRVRSRQAIYSSIVWRECEGSDTQNRLRKTDGESIMKEFQRYQKLENSVRDLEKKLADARNREKAMQADLAKYRKFLKIEAYDLPSGEVGDADSNERKWKQAEKTLRESEAQKRAILDASLDRIRYIDRDMRIIWANKATAEGLGIPAEALVGRACYEIFVGRHAPCEGCPAERAQRTGQIERAVMHQRKVEGVAGESSWDTYCVPLKNEMGETESFVQVARNITAQTQAMDALRESEGTLKAILAASPMGIGLVRNRSLDWANTAMYRILGYQAGSFLGEDGKMLYLDDKEWNRVGHELFIRVDEGSIGQTETRWVTKGGDVIDCYLQASPLDPKDRGRGHIVAAMDITDRKRAEERIHALTHQLMKAQENERQRISLYLHDDVAQNLSSLKIGLETIFDDPHASLPSLRQKAAELAQILQAAISAVRDLAYDQRPPSLDQLGLIQAVFLYCENFSEEYGTRVDFQSAGMDNLRLDFDTEINLYRLIQEALTNVRKHADAGQVIVRLVAAHPHIILRIEDNGKGFDVQRRSERALDEKRMGLQS
ncbi:MAG: PAS domain S-box protein, partial [Desulfatiglandaceae bacterium]